METPATVAGVSIHPGARHVLAPDRLRKHDLTVRENRGAGGQAAWRMTS